LRNALRSDWEGKLDVIGAGVGGVSFGDCVRQGREAGASWS
jgi:oxygen-dependent protoporphyrinogen oxidase